MNSKKLPKEIILNYRVDFATRDRLQQAAKKRRVKRSVIVRAAIDEYLKKLENQKSLESVA